MRNNLIKKIISFLFLIIIGILLFVIYKQVVFLLSDDSYEPYEYEDTNQENRIMSRYIQNYKNAIDNYIKQHNTVPTYDDIKNELKLLNNNVYCNTNEIYSDATFYINNCYIDNSYVNYSYGVKKQTTTKDGLVKNKYFMDNDFLYVKNATDLTPKTDKDLDNIIYTIINSGTDSFTITCDSSYTNCINHINDIMNQEYSLSYINSFVHPYNSYEYLSIEHNNRNKISFKIDKRYTEEEIAYIDKEIDKIISDNTNQNMSITEKIRAIHDYIINNSHYLTDEIKNAYPNITFNKANDILSTHYGLCNSYTDVMAIVLDKLNVKNYKIVSENHIWNLVYLNGEWLHLDLTWDDPITPNNEDVLDYTYFLITDEKLKELNPTDHDYDKNIFLELA